jgi:hypothetical protein
MYVYRTIYLILYNSHILFEKYCWTLYTRNYRKCTYCYCKSCFVSQKSGNILYISIATHPLIKVQWSLVVIMHSPCIPWQHGLPEISQVMWRSSPDTKLVLLVILNNSHILFEKYCWTLYTRNYRKCTYCYWKSCFVSQKSGNILYIGDKLYTWKRILKLTLSCLWREQNISIQFKDYSIKL